MKAFYGLKKTPMGISLIIVGVLVIIWSVKRVLESQNMSFVYEEYWWPGQSYELLFLKYTAVGVISIVMGILLLKKKSWIFVLIAPALLVIFYVFDMVTRNQIIVESF